MASATAANVTNPFPPMCAPSRPCGNCDLCDGEEEERDSWQPIDLGPYLRGEIVRPEPTLGMARVDGQRMLYPGKEHAVIGEMESGKSWFALACVVAELMDRHHVIYIHFEESDPSDTIDRLLALGVPGATILDLFQFVGPERRANADVITDLLRARPTLVVLDGVNEGMSLHGMAIREEDGAAAFRRLVVKPCIRAGAATLSCDHVVKDKESRGRYALGSIHKGNALSGAQFSLENAEPFGRRMRGRSHVYVTKDRPGHLRRHGRPDERTPGKTFVGELVVDDTHTFNPWLELNLYAPADKPKEPVDGDGGSELADDVFRAIAALPDQIVSSERHLFAVLRKANIKARDKNVRDAVDDLIAAKRVELAYGPRNAKGYRAVLTAAHDQSDVA